MATFTNQTTNLSTLSTLLTDLSRELKGPFHESGDPEKKYAETGKKHRCYYGRFVLLNFVQWMPHQPFPYINHVRQKQAPTKNLKTHNNISFP